MLNRIILFVTLLAFAQSAFALSCRKQIKRGKNKISQAENSIERAHQYIERHENFISGAKFDLAKKYLKLAIDRTDTSVSRYEMAYQQFEQTLQACPRRSRKLNRFMQQIQDDVEEILFQLTIYQEIYIRL